MPFTPPLPSHLYVHVPFCALKCDYCAFYSYAGSTADEREAFLVRIDDELKSLPPTAPLQSIYVGGGTPSTLSPEQLSRLFDSIAQLPRSPDCEISIECNPGSITRDRIQTLQGCGVNRFSLGVQSFSERLRKAIGRGGDVRTIERAVGILQDCGVRNYNCDLIYGIPEQTFQELERDVAQIISFQPAHVSTYSLIIEPNTALALRGGIEGDDDMVVAMWEYIGETLHAERGLERYEFANHAIPGRACRHNLDIWRGARFIGAGPSACWFAENTRYRNVPNLQRWLNNSPSETDTLDDSARAVEILATGLRTIAGWTPNRFRERTGFHWNDLRSDTIQELIADELLTSSDENLIPTKRGLLFHDHVTRELL